jgi:ferric-dicitrate binding protein FerR (iron transport regulator)
MVEATNEKDIMDKIKEMRAIRTMDRWDRLSRRIYLHHIRTKAWYIAKNAAAILFIPLLFTSLFLLLQPGDRNEPPVEQITVSAAYGLVTKITLPDQSEIWLNSGSTLTYPQRFSEDKRIVRLTGEAYFKVKADKKRRFDVMVSDRLSVSATGTEFNINAYEEDGKIEVVLAKGDVEVLTPPDRTPSHPLLPGQQLTYKKRDQTMAVSEANLYVKTSWKEGKMVFRRTSIHEIVKRLSRHFNVEIELKDKELHGYEYSATFTTESIHDILYLLEKSAPIRCKIIEPEQISDGYFTKRKVIIQLRR